MAVTVEPRFELGVVIGETLTVILLQFYTILQVVLGTFDGI